MIEMSEEELLETPRGNAEEAEPPSGSRAEPEPFKVEQSRIRYRREVLLEFCEVEVCCRLPEDFDVLILRELEDAFAGKAGNRMISCNSSCDGLLPSVKTNAGLLGERWRSNSLMLSKDSQLPKNCHSERKFVSSHLLEECGHAAGILGPKSQNLFQLSKSAVPYLPPHCRKEKSQLEPTTVCTHETKRLEGNGKTKNLVDTEDMSEMFPKSVSPVHVPHTDPEACASQATELIFGDFGNHNVRTTRNSHSSSGLQVNSCGQTNAVKKILQPMDASPEHGLKLSQNSYVSDMETGQNNLVDSTIENDICENGFPFLNIDDLLDSTDDECEAFWRNDDAVYFRMMKDDELRFDDVWAEVSLQMESKLAQLPISDDSPHSELRISLPDHLKSTELDYCEDGTSSDGEIHLPEEDDLITVEDLIAPYSLKSTFNRDSRKPHISGSVVHTKQSFCPAYISERSSPCSANDQVNYPAQFGTPHNTHYTPWNCYTYPNLFHHPFQETTFAEPNCNDTLVHYSLLEQPYTCPLLQTQLLKDVTACKHNKKMTEPYLNTGPLMPWLSETAFFQHLASPSAVCLYPAVRDFGDEIASEFLLDADGVFSNGCPFPSVLQPSY